MGERRRGQGWVPSSGPLAFDAVLHARALREGACGARRVGGERVRADRCSAWFSSPARGSRPSCVAGAKEKGDPVLPASPTGPDRQATTCSTAAGPTLAQGAPGIRGRDQPDAVSSFPVLVKTGPPLSIKHARIRRLSRSPVPNLRSEHRHSASAGAPSRHCQSDAGVHRCARCGFGFLGARSAAVPGRRGWGRGVVRPALLRGVQRA